MNTMKRTALLFALAFGATGCGSEAPGQDDSSSAESTSATAVDDGHTHTEVGLGKIKLGDFDVDLAQGHGAVEPGKESHLVVKLPYSDHGATTVRAWVGSEDRTLSYVGKGEYAPAHDDYDVHATAPDPLPEDPRWWVEIELPDGKRLLGSAEPLME